MSEARVMDGSTRRELDQIHQQHNELAKVVRGNGHEGLVSRMGAVERTAAELRSELEDKGVIKIGLGPEAAKLFRYALAMLPLVAGGSYITNSNVEQKINEQTTEVVAVVESKAEVTAERVAEAAENAAERGATEASGNEELLAEIARLRLEVSRVKTAVTQAKPTPKPEPKPAAPAPAPAGKPRGWFWQ